MDRATGKMVGTGGSAVSSMLGQLLTSAGIEEGRGLSCGALDPEFDAETQHVKCILRAISDGEQGLYARDPIPPPRSQTGAGLCVFH